MGLNLSLHVLVVTPSEEQATIREVLDALGGNTLYIEESPAKGLNTLKALDALDLIVVDEFDGFYNNILVKEWAKRDAWKKIPLILTTSEVTHLKLNIFRNHLIKHILIKPFSSNDFYTKLEHVFHLGKDFSEAFLQDLIKIPFFSYFQKNDLIQIIELGTIKWFETEKVLIREQGVIDKFGVILKGEVGIYRVEESKAPVLVNILSPGNFLGETNILSRERSSTRVVAHSKTLTFMLPYFAFRLLSEELRDQLFRLIIIDLSQKLRHTTSQLIKMNQ